MEGIKSFLQANAFLDFKTFDHMKGSNYQTTQNNNENTVGKTIQLQRFETA